VPRAYVPIIEGLSRHYGVWDEALLFFQVHAAEVDEHHTAANLMVIDRYVESGRDRREARAIVSRTSRLVWELLNVYRKY
jgi:pyrroloquinoline quinone (PQQ) biosynthesis protein C